MGLGINLVIVATFLFFFYRRIRRAHFDGLSNLLAVFGLPLFSLLLLNSYISHKRGRVRWKGREYGRSQTTSRPSEAADPLGAKSST
jgi:hypothetical protein